MKTENERFSVACLCCRQNLKFGDFTSSLCRGPLRYLLKSVLHVQHDYLCSFNLTNDIIVLWRCRSRTRRLFLRWLIQRKNIKIFKSVKLKQNDVSCEVLVTAIDVKCNFT